MQESMPVYKKSWFWTVLTGLTFGAILFSAKYLPVMLKEVNINLTMSRVEALQKAAALSQKYSWKPLSAQSATFFNTDHQMHYYTDLECGGNEEFQKIVQRGTYHPYTWQVRRFKEFSTYETFVFFTPQGKPYGFSLKIPEDEEGPSLCSNEARKKACAFAIDAWDINFDDYEEYETSQKELPNGRIIHSFVYQRKNEHLGKDGHYRLQLEVNGEIVSKLEHFIHIPESFTRRYQEMRTGNEAIASTAFMIYMILFFFLGGIIGGFILFKKRILLYKNAVVWAFILAFFSSLNTINQLPLLLMYYNTAMPLSSFLMNLITGECLSFFHLFFQLAITFATAESLTRMAFQNHIQLWETWSPKAAASFSVASQTIISYCLAIIKIAWVVIVYLFLTRIIGWWTPGEALVNPNIVATYQPWLEAVTNSLIAGFREECLFRAIPIAGGLLIGRYFKKERLGFIIGILLQAILFPAAHTSYVTYPSYFRIVEMMPITFFYAFIYIRYGLFPAVIIHWIYDLILMSLGVFIGHGSALILSKSLVIVLGGIPLFITAYYRWKQGSFNILPKNLLNNAWNPPLKQEHKKNFIKTKIHILSTHTRSFLITLTLASIFFGLSIVSFKNYAPTMNLSKSDAQTTAYAHMNNINQSFLKNVTIFDFITHTHDYEKSNRFVWEKLGKEVYQKLMGSYINAPEWGFRFVHFDGTLEERTEEYHIYINTDKQVTRVTHILPENKEGASLSKEEAHKKAYDFICSEYNLDKKYIKNISAIDSQKPNRKDWVFIFEDTSTELTQGKAHISVTLSGDEICNYKRFVYVPEDYIRSLEKEESQNNVISQVSIIVLILLSSLGTALFLSVLTTTESLKRVAVIAGGVGIITIINVTNYFPQTLVAFNTAQSFKGQILMYLGSLSFYLIIRVLFSTLLILATISVTPRSLLKRSLLTPLWGVCTGICLYTLTLYGAQWALPITPHIANYEPLGTYSIFGCIISPLVPFFRYAGFLIVLWWSLEKIEAFYHENFIIRTFFLTLISFASLGFLSIANLSSFAISGALLSLGMIFFYTVLFRKDYSLIIISIATMMSISSLHQGMLHAYKYAFIIGSLQATLLIMVSLIWFRKIKAHS